MILYLGNKLAKFGVTPTSVDTLGNEMQKRFSVVTGVAVKNKLLRLIKMLLLIRKYKKADYVLIDTYSTSAFWFAYLSSLYCKQKSIKYIPILHGGNLAERAKRSTVKISKMLDNAATVISPSGFLKHELQKYTKTDIQIIPNYIEIDQYKFSLRDYVIGQEIKVLWVRSFHNIYNPEMAIDLINSLRNKGVKATLTMVGPDKDGSLEKCKVKSRVLKIEEYIVFTGRLSKEDWHTLAADHHVFINTTNVDNTPVSVIEAMALGLPVVSTNVGGLPFIVENYVSGILVEKNNVDDMAKSIERLISDPDLRENISSQALKYAQSCDLNLVLGQWTKIIN